MHGSRDATPSRSFLTKTARSVQALSGETATSPFTEASVLYASTLPTFQATISEEDAEALLSSLAVPRLRVPLVLDFFAHGRTGALLNADLQALFCSSLFELSDVSADKNAPPITSFPEPDRALMSTLHGVLLNELTRDAALNIDAVERMLADTYTAANKTDFRAPFLPMMLFLLCQATRVLSFMHVAMDHSDGSSKVHATERMRGLIGLLEGCIEPLVTRWDAEATLACEYAVVTRIKHHLAFLHAVLARVRPTPGRGGGPLTDDPAMLAAIIDAQDVQDIAHVLGCMAYVEARDQVSRADSAGGTEQAADANEQERVRKELLAPHGVHLSLQELRQAHQAVRVSLVRKLERFEAINPTILADVLNQIAQLAVGARAMPGGSAGWMRDRSGSSSPCTFTNGVVVIDAAAGRVLVGQSHVQPTPSIFRTNDFKAFFGAAVPNCVVLKDSERCVTIQLWHEGDTYVVEWWSSLFISFELSEGHVHNFLKGDKRDLCTVGVKSTIEPLDMGTHAYSPQMAADRCKEAGGQLCERRDLVNTFAKDPHKCLLINGGNALGGDKWVPVTDASLDPNSGQSWVQLGDRNRLGKLHSEAHGPTVGWGGHDNGGGHKSRQVYCKKVPTLAADSVTFRGLNFRRGAAASCCAADQPLAWLPSHVAAVLDELGFIRRSHSARRATKKDGKKDEGFKPTSEKEALECLLMLEPAQCSKLLSKTGAVPCLLFSSAKAATVPVHLIRLFSPVPPTAPRRPCA